eukprot:s508_g24.t1
MVPSAPSLCGVRGCIGGVKEDSSKSLPLRCDLAVHHKGFLCRDSAGLLSWKWVTRTGADLTKKGFEVLRAVPEQEPENARNEPAEDRKQEAEAIVPSTPPRNGAQPEQVAEVTPEKPKAEITDKLVRGRPNFGGQVRRKANCEVCGVCRDDFFHGNLCDLCPKIMRQHGFRRYMELTEDQKRDMAEKSDQARQVKNENMAASERRIAEAVAAEVTKRLRKAGVQL